MFKLPLVCFLLCGALTASAQVKVNPKAEEALKDRYKKAKDVLWSEIEKGFKATFDNDGYPAWSEFEKSGKWIRTETEVTEELLHLDFVNSIYTKFPEAFMPKVLKVETPESTTFEVVVDDDGKEYSYSVDTMGKIINGPK